MLGQLVESSPKRVRRGSSTLVSFVAHVLVVSGAVAAARPVPDEPPVDRVIVLHPPAPTPPECTRCAARSPGGSPGRTHRGESTLPDGAMSEFTISVPDHVGPPIGGVTISAEEWTGTLPGRTETTSVLGSAAVDREVVPWPTNPVPRYPATLRAGRIEGSVFARFVVDTSGRVVMESVVVNAADHPLFADAVIEALRRARFSPAELRGHKVAQLVVQPFVFVIR